MSRQLLLSSLLLGTVACITTTLVWAANRLPDYAFAPPAPAAAATKSALPADTMPPIRDRFGDFINDPNPNPIDLNDPAGVEQNVEYDPATGGYLIQERIGETFFRPPTYMSFEEYLEYRQQQDQNEYFDMLSGGGRQRGLGLDDPLAGIDVKNSLLDRLFGGNTIDIKPQGGIDLTFGLRHQKLLNPILTIRQQRQTIFDFDMNIQMNVVGKIGEKLTLNTNYNTNATFNFDNQFKINYNSDLFSEDDIIKKIEAGNVSFPTRGTLIQGAESLFGLKTELQFGHLRLTAIGAQQQSQRENITLQGGSQVTEFEVKSDRYDENRHFFLSHYNRDAYEAALGNLPQINTLFHLESIEVWITNDRNEVTDVRDIVALADLGEPVRLTSPDAIPTYQEPRYQEICEGRPLPENGANGLYSKIVARGDMRSIDRAVAVLQSSEFGLVQSRDFEKVQARKLNPREYTFHPELGFISVNINVQPDQVLAVSYRYKYNGQIFRVGEMSTNTDDVAIEADTTQRNSQVLFVKLLKSMTQRIDVPAWDLMMKNVYSIGAYQVNPQDFKFDVFYEDPGRGVKRFLPKSNLEGKPLIRVFNLDNLNVQGDPQPDGVFDFVPGVTINPANGRIYFPVLEPFGSHLERQITDAALRDTFVYNELYDLTQFQAQEYPEKNRYVIKGTYKSTVSSEISLGAFNIPPGSVRVSAGGAALQEGRDYEVDYATGKVRILNDAILSSGVPVNVSFEDNTLFGFQTKTMVGLRADYEVSDKLNIGASYLQLFERPFTPKVNIGDDPINNRIMGLDLNYSSEAPWLTRLADKLPFYSTNQTSNINFTAEAAYLKPGHARAINQSRSNKDGIVYIDDFEGASANIDLRQPVNQWFLSSIPRNDENNNNPLFPEALEEGLVTGANRARINWYRLDPITRDAVDDNDPYTSIVPQNEVFPNLNVAPDQLPNVQTFDLAFYPDERGPYNFDTPAGYNSFSRGVEVVRDSFIRLRDPQTRWGGIMRALNTNDFQTANIEFLELWMLSPFLDTEDATEPSPDAELKQGTLYINLGNISEDILKDSRKFFENGLPGPANPNRPVDTTIWSRVPIGQQITRAFDNDPETRALQDVGLDGFDDAGEADHYRDWINAIGTVSATAAGIAALDPSGDNFLPYNDNSFNQSNAGVRERYRRFNNPQGNSRANDGGGDFRQSGTNIPDAEDINQDNTLNESESYFQYEVPLFVNPLDRREIDVTRTPFVTDKIEDARTGRIWYRLRIPLNGPQRKSIGGIRDFRSILFMRMYMHGFERPTILRFARMELVRNQWRRYTQNFDFNQNTSPDFDETSFDIDAVNIEENSSRTPFAYTLPPGIQRERNIGVFNTLQNEQSLALRIGSRDAADRDDGLRDGDARAVFKYTEHDLRIYERLRMNVHAEAPERDVPNGALSLFVRLGSDFKENYYEYEIPLVMSDSSILTGLNTNSDTYKREVWRSDNELNFPLAILRSLKEERNDLGLDVTREYVRNYTPEDQPNASHTIKVRGNPNLGFVKVMMIGVRNPVNEQDLGAKYKVEVWANELRVTGLDERGSTAAIARLDLQIADLGTVTAASNYSSIGFGAISDRVGQRARESTFGYDVAANLDFGKFLPDDWGVRLPFYTQVSRTANTPEYDPYDLDIRLKDKLNSAPTSEVRDSIREQAQEVVQINSYNFTNVRKEKSNATGSPKPWDISNFSVSYGVTETDRSDPLISNDNQVQQTGGLDYTFSRNIKYFEPFKGLNAKPLRIIKEFNLNPLPNSFTFNTVMDRRFARTSYRFAGVDERFNTFFNKRFLWNRTYDLQWDLTKALKLGFNASNNAVIDEPDEIWMLENLNRSDIQQFRRDSIWNNVRQFGRPKLYQHTINASYTLPIRYLPFMDWVSVRAQYNANYSWNAAALNVDTLGNVIQNGQTRQLTADLSFDKLYDQSKFLKAINRPARPAGRTPSRTPVDQRNPDSPAQPQGRQAKDAEPSQLARALIRPLLLVRKARLNFSEQLGTTIPGFMPQSSLLGMDQGFGAPGIGFVAGWQPRIRTLSDEQRFNPAEGNGDWLYDNRRWITNSVFFNRDVVQTYTQTIDGRLTLEPYPDFRIEIDISKQFAENYTETFKDTTKNDVFDYVHAVPTYGGNLSVSYSALRTLFQDNDDQIVQLFRTFERNRPLISQRLGTGPHLDPSQAAQGYTDGYGRTQQDVILSAFVAAYTAQDPRSMDMNLFNTMPRPNWRATYSGLAKLPAFKKIFSNFNISHGYKSTFTVNTYRTGLDYLASQNQGGKDTIFFNFYPRLEIPDLVIQEGFQPMLAIEATLVNGMSFNFDYKQSRNLALSVTSKILSETRTKDITAGFGYIMKGVNIGLLTGKRNKRGSSRPPAPATGGTNQGLGARSSGRLSEQDLDLRFNFSLRDDVTYAHKLDLDVVSEPTRGTFALNISPSAEYQLNKRLSLRVFTDYRRTIPKNSLGFPRTDVNGGVVVRFQLQ